MPARSDGLVAGTAKLGMFAVLLGLYAGAFLLLAWPWLSGAVTIPWDAKSQFQPELQFLATSLPHGIRRSGRRTSLRAGRRSPIRSR